MVLRNRICHTVSMKTILNIIWFFFAGLPMAIAYGIAGIIFAITIVGIPFAVAAFRLASYTLWPFGRTVVAQPSAGSTIGNVAWFVLAGWWLALAHATSALAMAATIIGIPMAIAELKLIPLALFPLGKTVVATSNVQYGLPTYTVAA